MEKQQHGGNCGPPRWMGGQDIQDVLPREGGTEAVSGGGQHQSEVFYADDGMVILSDPAWL